MASQVTQYLFFFALAAGSMAAIAHGSSLPSTSRSTAFAQNALFLKGDIKGLSAPHARSQRPAVASVSMMASPLNLRSRASGIVDKCKVSAKGLFTATAAALCFSAVTMSTKPAVAATAAELAAEIVEDDTELFEGGEAVASTAAVEIEYTGMRKLSLSENAIKYGVLVGGFGGWLTYTIFEGKREDRDEEQRVKEEVERIEQWKKEFIDMEDVVGDDDLMDSLNKRMSGETDGDVDDADGSGGIPRNYSPDDDDDGGSGGAAAAAPEDAPADIDSAKMDQLKRMFGTGDGDK